MIWTFLRIFGALLAFCVLGAWCWWWSNKENKE
jgi:hypothetical protein